MNGQNKNLEHLVNEGYLESSVAQHFAKDAKESREIAAVIGAAIDSTESAYNEALKSNIPFCVAEDGILFEVAPDGSRTFVREITKNTRLFPSRLTLK